MADAKKKEEPTKPTPEEKLAAAEAEVDALVKKGLKALDEFEKLDQKQVDHIVIDAGRSRVVAIHVGGVPYRLVDHGGDLRTTAASRGTCPREWT